MWIAKVIYRILGPIIGIFFAVTILFTSLFGNYILTLTLPFVTIFNFHKEWRRYMDRAISFWMIVPMFFLKFVFRVKLRLSGDLIDVDEPAILIMNHRTRLDWLYFKLALFRMNPWLMTTYKVALKELLRYAPGSGFGMQSLMYIFLRRDVKTDFARISRVVDYYTEMDLPYQILMFPEGTDKTAFTTRRSNEYAKKNNLPELQHVLYPRTAGFIHMVNKMKKNGYINYVYDVTIAYPKEIVQTEVDLVLRGRCSSHVHYDVRKIPISELPEGDEELSNWLMDLWREKDEKLIQFYNNRQKSKRKLDASGASGNLWVQDSYKQNFVLIFGITFWISVVCVWIWHLTFLWAIRCSLLFLILNYFYIFGRYGGIDYLLLDRFELWKNGKTGEKHIV